MNILFDTTVQEQCLWNNLLHGFYPDDGPLYSKVVGWLAGWTVALHALINWDDKKEREDRCGDRIFRGWGAKDFDARKAHEIFLEPNPNLAYRWGTYDFLGGVLRWDGALRWGWARWDAFSGPNPCSRLCEKKDKCSRGRLQR